MHPSVLCLLYLLHVNWQSKIREITLAMRKRTFTMLQQFYWSADL